MSTIVVGVSGTDAVHPAVVWTMEYAAANNADVVLVHVVDVTWGFVSPEYTEKALLQAEQQLHAQESQAQALAPRVRVRSRVQMGSPVSELALESHDADLIVVGDHPTADSHSRIPARLAATAACAVIVVPSQSTQGQRGVVVGVDGSADSAAAVEFAAKGADRIREPLRAIYSWSAPQPWAGSTASMLWPIEPRDEDRLVLSESIVGLADRYPDLEIVPEVVVADPATALTEAGNSARMVVVGSRGRHGLTKAYLGSVSDHLVRAMPCVVAVVRPVSTDN